MICYRHPSFGNVSYLLGKTLSDITVIERIVGLDEFQQELLVLNLLVVNM